MIVDGKSPLGMEDIPCGSKDRRFHGPYPHRSKWRLVVQAADGSREYLSFATEAQARSRRTALLKEIAGRTVSEAVQEFVVDQREGGLRAGTVKVAEFRLRAFFQLDGVVAATAGAGRASKAATDPAGRVANRKPTSAVTAATDAGRASATVTDPALGAVAATESGRTSDSATESGELAVAADAGPASATATVTDSALRVVTGAEAGRASGDATEAMLHVVGDEPATAASGVAAPRKPARRGSRVAAKPALRVLRSDKASATAAVGEPTSAGDYVGNGQ